MHRYYLLSQKKFMDLQLEELDLCLKLVNEVEQRWSSAIKVLKRVLTLWDVLSTHYRDNEHKTFPLASYKTILMLRILLMHFVTIAIFMCCLLYACT
jgi:hypothetical protein